MGADAKKPSAKMAQKLITVEAIEKASTRAKRSGKDDWLTDPAPRGSGRFTVRCTPAGARICMFRYTLPDGSRDVLRLGDFDEQGSRGLTLKAARERAGELSRLYLSGTTDLRTHLASQEQQRIARDAEARRVEDAARDRAARGSLQALMDAYCATLEGRQSQDDASGMFRLHVTAAFPSLATAPAADVTAEQFRDVLARLIDAGKGRTAAKLRAYLRAAFSVAMRAGLDPTVPGEFSAFDVKVNQLERLPSLARYSRALDRALTLPELLAFWQRLQVLPPGAAKDAVTAAMLLGGQRPSQLLRVTAGDVDATAGTIVLRDIKGRNRHATPRRHVLPIVDELTPLIERRLMLCTGAEAPLFSSNGKVALRKETAGQLVTDLCAAMTSAGEIEQGAFSMRDLRRTAETHMAALGINSDTRAQIQSHGMGGIQQRHYDRHDYMEEKRSALMHWARRLAGQTARVMRVKRVA